MLMIAQGGCYCGALRYEVNGEPVIKALCFCRVCQHVAGGGPAVIMAVPESAFAYVAGHPNTFRHPDVDLPAARDFCPTCGIHVMSRSPRAPGLALVKVGTLDDPGVYGKPARAVHFSEAHAFHAVPEGVPTFERT